jgi:ribose transport system substrate-binding protein
LYFFSGRRRRCTPLIAVLGLLTGACSATGTPEATAPTSAGVVAAQGAVQKALAPPASIGLTTPLRTRPTGGGTVVYLDPPGGPSNAFAQAMGQAATAAGLTLRVLAEGGPADVVPLLHQALAITPAPLGVAFLGLPEQVWQSVVPDYEKAGVPLIPIGVGVTTPSRALPGGSLDSPDDTKAQATAIADYFIADSHGTGKALLVNITGVGSFTMAVDQFQTTVATGCPNCRTATVDVTVDQLNSGNITLPVLSGFQEHPDANYLMIVEGDSTHGMAPALRSAGFDAVKILGMSPWTPDYSDLVTRSGGATAYAAMPYHLTGWKVVDVALRVAQGLPVAPGDGPLPLQLLTHDTVIARDDPDRPDNYQDQFKTLWHVG